MLLRRPVAGRRGPGLLGSVARTAVVAGTATAAAGTVHRWSERRKAEVAREQAAQQAVHDQQQLAQPPAQLDAEQPQPAVSPAPPDGRRQQPMASPAAAPVSGAVAPTSAAVDLMSQLKQLADLKASGVLTDAEFSAAKAKLLGT
ncbi:SHOCT domain-containing protein [Catellatospora paridis]|uniref:SHOCT domain-containing protein n=1 Tax=Catellatospora paridis TaxID=1617086 RepID=UPI0012D397FB|nr:SHOCT domain-containing protein [Catellatospora paridis]